MNIKSSLTIKFTAIVAGILIAFSIFTYEFSEIFRRNEFTDRLKNVSKNVVINYLDKEELTPGILRLLYDKQINRFPQEKLIVADENYEVIFTSKPADDTQISLLKRLYREGNEFEQYSADTEYIAYIIPHNGVNFYVVSSALDIAGQEKLKFLRLILLILTLACIGLAAITGWYFSMQALKPIKDVISQVDTINESNLHQRVYEGNGKDEIANLAIVFNKMLGRIEKSFAFQKLFVANASHEFRTPLTVMKGQIEVLMLQKRSEQEYIAIFHSLLEDIQNLISLINGLAELASANADFPNISFTNVSILDVMMDTKEELVKRKPTFRITLEFGDFPEEEELIYTKGDFSLLKSVFTNLMDNACKFSGEGACNVKVIFEKLGIEITITDKGPGIKPSDLPHIFEPFFRSNETRQVPGYGIGLSLVKKTIELHKGTVSIHSETGSGTTVRVYLPNNYIT
jgi:two-component system sensor histidine kinase ArlS